MDCPVCREPLIVAERNGIELDVCLWCHGLWFDAGELELLSEKLGRTLAVKEGFFEKAQTAEKARPCPRCDRPMEKVLAGTVPKILLDRCGGHGVWFDHGELGTLIRQLAQTPGSHAEAVVQFMGESFSAPAPPSPSANEPVRGAGEVER